MAPCSGWHSATLSCCASCKTGCPCGKTCVAAVKFQLQLAPLLPLAQVAPGETRLVEYELRNPFGRDAVFAVATSHPDALAPVESAAEYAALKVAAWGGADGAGGSAPARVGTAPLAAQLPARDGGGVQLLSGGKVFLAANERVVLPFRLRLAPQQRLALPAAATTPTHANGTAAGSPLAGDGLGSGAWGGVLQSAGGSCIGGAAGEQLCISVEFIPTDQDYPTSVLELQVSENSNGAGNSVLIAAGLDRRDQRHMHAQLWCGLCKAPYMRLQTKLNKCPSSHAKQASQIDPKCLWSMCENKTEAI